jgi:chromosome segregation ATPase
MHIINDTPGMDYLTYFTTQMPKDLAAMAALRDELAIRQGALSAAEDTVKLKAEAVAVLEAAKAEAAAMVADTKVKNAEALAKKKAQDIREADLNARETNLTAQFAARDQDLTQRETQAQTQLESLERIADQLAADQAQLFSDRAALEARIKAFQDKVAALNA